MCISATCPDLAKLGSRSRTCPRDDAEPPLQKLIADRYGGRDLPVALVLPDGARVPLSPSPEVDIIARTFAGLRALATPAMGALARAYVHNDVDFTGSARRVLAHRRVDGRRHRARPRRRARPRAAASCISAAATARTSRTTTTSRTRSTGCGSTQRMVYSCAYFRTPDDTLDDAQAQKLDHICRKLRLAPGERFLDIGCGWGALIFRAAENYGVDATGITLSQNQFDHVQRARSPRAASPAACASSCATTRTCPTTRRYDKIASVGMFEHVGPRRLPTATSARSSAC